MDRSLVIFKPADVRSEVTVVVDISSMFFKGAFELWHLVLRENDFSFSLDDF